MTAEELARWISTADVQRYGSNGKEVFIATDLNKQLILTCHRVAYPHGLFPHIKVVWIDTGRVELLYQDMINEQSGQIMGGIGSIQGLHTARENIETIWCALMDVLKNRLKGE